MENSSNTKLNETLKVIYKCLFITKEENNKHRIIFGRIIQWIMHPLDYENFDGACYDTKHKFKVFMIDYKENPLNTNISNNVFTNEIRINNNIYNLFFNWTENNENIFLEKAMEQKAYNPFINYCTNCRVFFNPMSNKVLYEEIENYTNKWGKDIEKIDNNSRVNLIKNPELINTLIYYEPHRISYQFKGFKEEKTGFRIRINDEFDLYSDCEVKMKYFINNTSKEERFLVKEKNKEIQSDDVPDNFEITISNTSGIVFREKCSVIKRINISISYPDKNIVINNDKIELHKTENLSIGE